MEEVMVVLKGDGKVSDDDGDYDYSSGDVFVFPANIVHKISNNSDEEHEMIFMRVKV
jgi:quercetin dioxygenase-like cupin family protein